MNTAIKGEIVSFSPYSYRYKGNLGGGVIVQLAVDHALACGPARKYK